jgi:competence protein ComEC
MPKTLRVLILVILSLGTLLFGALVWWQHTALQETKVVFLDVGQGDAILIQQGTLQILIDSSQNGKRLLSELGRQIPFWDRTIELIILTHPDADHIAGFASLAKSYRIKKILWTGVEGESDFYTQFVQVLEKKVPKEHWHKASAGTKLVLPEGGTLTFLYPHYITNGKAKDEDTNATSIVSRFEYGDTSFLLTGDLVYEEGVLGKVAPVTVLKAAHHGSKYSTSSFFLDMVKPKDVVVSVGKNTYGHPHPDVLGRIQKQGAKTLRTDEWGSIVYQCQNKKECFLKSKSKN